MGVAFDSLILGPGISFFPAVSLAYNDNLCANFGGTPLRYPEEDYQPLQVQRTLHIIVSNLYIEVTSIISGTSSCRYNKS